MTKIKIDVTQENINTGVKESRCFCPIAKALRSKRLSHVQVGGASIYFYIDDKPYDSSLPVSACNFIRKFDAGINVEPFSFEIEF